MVPLPNLLAFLAAAVVLVIMPGPTVLFVVGRSLALGRRGGLLSVLGNAIGLVPIIVAVAFGVGAIIAESVVVFTILKFVGAAYIVYLGIQAIRHRRRTAETVAAGVGRKSARRMLGEGFLVGVTNPKTIAFFLAVLPQFVVPTAPLLPQYAAIGATMVIVDLVVMGLYTGLAVRLLKWLHTPRQQTIVNRVFSGLFAAAAVVLSLVRRAATV